MKLNEKQFAALDALLNERTPSAESIRAQVLNNARNRWIEGAVQTWVDIDQPTLAEINARVMRDSVVWEDDPQAREFVGDATFKATVGEWTLRVRRCAQEQVWRWRLTASRGRGSILGHDSALTEDEAKSRCIAMLQELGVPL